MSESFEIREVDASSVQPLRTEILRDFEAGQLCIYDEDDRDDTHHFAVVGPDEQIRGVLTYIRRDCPDIESRSGVQLRGMAIAEDHQGEGLGTRLVDVSLPRLALVERDVDLVWCNARQHAVSFYERLGFEQIGEAFEVEGIGPHVRMWRKMPVVIAAQ